MGTNYYLHTEPPCECCGKPRGEELHIGKSSGGWCFSLHVIPDDSINTLDDWRHLFSKPGSYIRNEYGERVTVDQMLKTITERSWRGEFPQRHELDGRHCIGHGDGTWDYITGEFS